MKPVGTRRLPHRTHPRFARCLLLGAVAVAPLLAQAPLLQDGATALRQAQRDWILSQAPQTPSSLPSLEVGWGGAGSDGRRTPIIGGEGLGTGTQGWGLGLQGRVARDGWSFGGTVLALNEQGRTVGLLQRGAIAFQTTSGWRVALEEAPFAWGSGLLGGDLLGDAARPFPRLSLGTPEATLPLGRWRAETFVGRLERERPLPEWIDARAARISARTAGLDLQRPVLLGGLVRGTFGPWLETSLGAIALQGGQTPQGQGAVASSARTGTLLEARLRLPALAHFLQAQGAALLASRSAAPDTASLSLAPARDLAGLQVLWEGWELALEYAGPTRSAAPLTFLQPSYLEGFSTRGDPLGPAFAGTVTTRTIELGLPVFLDGLGRIRALRATSARAAASETGTWFLQTEAQWRTSTGRLGTALAFRRAEQPATSIRRGWSCTVFQAFRVF